MLILRPAGPYRKAGAATIATFATTLIRRWLNPNRMQARGAAWRYP